MTEHYYPAFAEEKVLLTITKLAKASPTYFDDPNCPYDEKIKELLNVALNPPTPISVLEEELGTEELPDSETTHKKITGLIEELEQYGREENMSSADRNTYFRLSVTLLQKLVELQEKSSMLSKHAEFINEILSIMNDVCDADDRAKIQERLKRFTGE